MSQAAASPSAPIRLGGHVPALDALRGLAILLVMGFHFGDFSSATVETAEAPDMGLLKGLRQGSYGVDLFFVLSGFLITGILFDAKEAPRRYFRTFYVRRTLRIFPLYYAVLLGTFVLLPLATLGAVQPYEDSAEHQIWLWLYGTNILQSSRNAFLLTGFNHFWSLAVEEHFYLVWPLVIWFCSRRAAIVVSMVCIAAAIVLRLVLALAGDYAVAIYTLTPCRMDALALGSLLALTARGPGGVRSVLPWALGGGAASGVLLGLVYLFGKRFTDNAEIGNALRHTFWAGFFGGVLMGALTVGPTSWSGRFWNSRTLRFFGKYSYGLYVFHYLLLPLFQKWFPTTDLTQATGSPILARILFILAATGASVVAALISWHLFEKHLLKLKDRWTPAKPARKAARSAEC